MKQSYIKLILILIIYAAVHVFFNSSAQKNGSLFYTLHDGKPPRVYDILHENLPDEHKMGWLTNMIVLISLLPLLLNFKESFFMKFIGLLLTIFILRDITINLTILPKHPECEIPSNSFILHTQGGCYDKIFSGHFAVVFILSLLYYSFQYITNIPLLVLWNVVNALVIITTHSHYTIDVVMSLFVCYIVYDKDLDLLKLLSK
jgi:hypothetical protein